MSVTAKERVRALPLPLAPLLVVMPLVAAALITFWQTGHVLYPYGDHAIVQGETQRALHGDQLVGTYSRYGWDHPGPALFFWMAPFYALFGHSPAALNGAAAVLNALVLALLVAVVAKLAGRTAGFFAAALALLYIVQQGPTIVRDFWIPHTVILPFAALIVVTAGAAAGRIMLLPFVALLASFLAETDLSVAPASGVVVIAGIVFFVATRGWRGLAWTRSVWLMLAGTLAIVAIVWYPPVKQALDPGLSNLTAIRDFFKQPDPGHTLHDAIASVANAFETIWHGHRSALDAIPAGRWAYVFLVVTIVLLVAGIVVALRDGRRFPAALCWLSLVAIGAEIYAVTNVRGELFTYLIDWFGVTAIVAGTGIACAIAPWLAGRVGNPSLEWAAPAVAAGAAALLAVWGVADQAGNAGLAGRDDAYINPSMKPIDIAVRNWISRNNVRDPVIYIPNAEQWPLAAGIYIDQLKRDKPVAIDPVWLKVFGPRNAPTGHEDAAIVVASAASPPKVLEKGSRKIADVNGTVVFADTRPKHG